MWESGGAKQLRYSGEERGQSQPENIPIANADPNTFYKPSGTQISPGEKERRMGRRKFGTDLMKAMIEKPPKY